MVEAIDQLVRQLLGKSLEVAGERVGHEQWHATFAAQDADIRGRLELFVTALDEPDARSMLVEALQMRTHDYRLRLLREAFPDGDFGQATDSMGFVLGELGWATI